MRKRYKVVLNLEIEGPEKPYPAGGDYTHLTRIEGVVHTLLWSNRHLSPGIQVSLDKVVDKGEVEE